MRIMIVTIASVGLIFMSSVCSGQSSSGQGSTHKSSTTAKGVSSRDTGPAVQTAVWRERPWGELLGIKESDFHQLGLDKLPSEEAERLAIYLLINRPSFSCQRYYPSTKKDELNRVHLYVEAGDESSATFVGNLRSKFAAISDVQLVYSDEDADLIVSVLAGENHLTTGHTTGFTATSVVAVPCVYNSPSGYDSGARTTRKYVDHYLNSGPDADTIAKTLVNTMSVSMLDPIRRDHASTLKQYEAKN
jgi:hypothetical protein